MFTQVATISCNAPSQSHNRRVFLPSVNESNMRASTASACKAELCEFIECQYVDQTCSFVEDDTSAWTFRAQHHIEGNTSWSALPTPTSYNAY
eukprot:3760505-Amphidinium_carterae.1